MNCSLKIAFVLGLIAFSVAVPLETAPGSSEREGRQYGYGGYPYGGGLGGLGYSGSNAFASANAGSSGFGGLGFSGANAAASANSFGGGFGK